MQTNSTMLKMSRLLISKITRNTSESVLISFDIPESEKEKFRFQAGQYLTLEAEIDGNPVRRSYSICCAVDEGLQVGVKAVPNGVFSNYANQSLNVNDQLLVAPPEGRFLYETDYKPKNIAAFAAGSGITPIMSILKSALSDHPANRFHLVYGNKSKKDTMFYSELKELEKTYEGRLEIQWVFNRENVAGSLFGRIDAGVVKNALTKIDDAAMFYLCGPENMIQGVSETLTSSGIEQDRVMFELFTSKAAVQEVKGQGQTLEIIYDDASQKIENIDGKSVLDAALHNKMDVPYSCQGGVCSSCIARIKSGTATMVSNQILTDQEVEEGLILTCQAHPTSPHLIVDYDDV